MCDIAKRDDKDIFDKETLKRTELSLVPFFYVHIASKGNNTDDDNNDNKKK